jgi:hypothetical protein
MVRAFANLLQTVTLALSKAGDVFLEGICHDALPMDMPEPIPKDPRIPFTIGGAVKPSRASEDPSPRFVEFRWLG